MLPHNKELESTAKALRKNMTKQQKDLWDKFLRKHPRKFSRQKIIGDYIVDFYSDSAKLVIELYSSPNNREESSEYEKSKKEFFSSFGIKVIGFTNDECKNNFDRVCTIIDKFIKSYLG